MIFKNIKELSDFDTIVIDNNITNKIRSKLYTANTYMPVFGILSEGVIKHSDYAPNITHYIYFRELGDCKIEIQDYLYYHRKNKLYYCFSIVINYTPSDSYKTIEDRIIESNYSLLFRKQGKSDMLKTIMSVQATYLAVFGFLHLTQLSQDVKFEINNLNSKKMPSNNPVNKQNNYSSKNIININELKIVTNKNPCIIIDKFKKPFKRKSECWSVRGHYRTLKSGKKIFIKSYQKGNRLDNDSYTSKNYLLKE